MQRVRMSFLLLLAISLWSTGNETVLCQRALNNPLNQLARTSSFEVFRVAMQRAPKAYLFDKFGLVTSNDEKARLDSFAIELQRDPGAAGYIVVFGKRGRPPSEAKKRADNAKKYLWHYNRTSNKLESIDHCFRATVEYELWIVPRGARVPTPCSTNAARKT